MDVSLDRRIVYTVKTS